MVEEAPEEKKPFKNPRVVEVELYAVSVAQGKAKVAVPQAEPVFRREPSVLASRHPTPARLVIPRSVEVAPCKEVLPEMVSVPPPVMFDETCRVEEAFKTPARSNVEVPTNGPVLTVPVIKAFPSTESDLFVPGVEVPNPNSPVWKKLKRELPDEIPPLNVEVAVVDVAIKYPNVREEEAVILKN